MNACLEVFEQGCLQLPKDDFLSKGALLLRGGPRVSDFQGLCLAELKRCYGRDINLPYSLQSGWIHNVRLAKSMVLWALYGRRALPSRLPRGKDRLVAMTAMTKNVTQPVLVNSYVPPTPAAVVAVVSWEDRILNLAWQMLQHVLTRWPTSATRTLVPSKETTLTPTLPLAQPRVGVVDKNMEKLFYPAQMEMAERLYETLFSRNDQELYEEVDFRILLPPSVSLQAQTELRLMQVFGRGCVGGGGRKVLNRHMFRNGMANEDFRALKRAVMEVDPVSGKKRRMVVIVMDECHVGIGRGGQMDVLVKGAAHAKTKTWANPERILMEENVFVVYVSATGWNCMPGVLPERTIIWNEDPAGYTGWKSYANVNGCNRERLRNGEGYQWLLDYFRSIFRSSGDGGAGGMDPEMFTLLPSLVLMVDYGLGFLGSSLCSAETQEIVNAHCESNASSGSSGSGDVDCLETTVIRVQQNGAQGAMVKWLNYFVNAVNSSSRVETSVEGLVKKGDKETKSVEDGVKNRFFCVLVEKGRFGDSFPGRLLHYDLRARYHGSKTGACSFSSLMQDVGRCFGYHGGGEGEASMIVLNPEGYRLFMGQEVKNIDRYLTKTCRPHRNSMWFKTNEAKENRVENERFALLLAQPQVGKTGVYLRMLQMLMMERGMS